MDKLNIESIIIVEGKHDTARLKEFFNCHTIETNGADLPSSVIKRIESASKHHEIIILTDPDYVGEKIRKRLTLLFPEALHAFITKEEGQGKRNKGIEYASFKTLKKALESSIKFDQKKETISYPLFLSSTYHYNSSRKLREKICEELRLGNCNNKQFFIRLNAFNISFEKLEEITKKNLKATK